MFKLPRVILYANASKVHLGGFQILNKAILRLRLLNLANRLLVESIHLTFFIYLNTKPVVLWTRAPTYDKSKDKKEGS